MKRITIVLIIAVTALAAQFALPGNSYAQDYSNPYDYIKSLAEDSLEAQAKPFVQAFGNFIGGGLYHTADTHGMLGFDAGVRGMIVMIPSGKSQILDSADVKAIGLPVVQASVGLPMGFELMARGMGGFKVQDQQISLIGAGVKKNVSMHIPIPMFPKVAVMAAVQQFKAGDIVKVTNMDFALMVSKGFMIIEPYAGFGIGNTSMKFSYTYNDPTLGDIPIAATIKASTARFTLGFNLSPFPFVKVFADYNFGKFQQATAGAMISFR